MFCFVSVLQLDTMEALQTLYNATGGKNWRNQVNWSTADFCSFNGITCNENKSVTHLDLMGNNLVGELP